MKSIFKRATAAALVTAIVMTGSITNVFAAENADLIQEVSAEAASEELEIEETAANVGISEFDAEITESEVMGNTDPEDTEAAESEDTEAAESENTETEDSKNTEPAEPENKETAADADTKSETAAEDAQSVYTRENSVHGNAEANALAKQTMDLMHSEFDAALTYLGTLHPAFKFTAPIMQMIMAPAFTTSQKDINTVISEKLDELNAQLDSLEASMKDHMENVVTLATLGDKTGTVDALAEKLRIRVGNIQRDDNLSSEEKDAQIAALFDQNVVTDLESALIDATNTFMGKTNVTLGNLSIFDAAYNRAAEQAMFSGEALDAIAPYIVRQLGYYTEGFSVLGQVYTAYENIKGAGSLKSSRQFMDDCLTGSKSPYKFSAKFFSKDRFIFINKSCKTNIPLSPEVAALPLRSDYVSLETIETKAKEVPLSRAQVEALVSYCSEKNMTLFQFLFNKMQFRPVYTFKENRNTRYVQCPYNLDRTVKDETEIRTYYTDGKSYMLSGAHELPRDSVRYGGSKFRPGKTVHYVYADIINADRVNAGTEGKFTLYQDSGTRWTDITLMLFQAA